MGVGSSRRARPPCSQFPTVSLSHWHSAPPPRKDRNEKPDGSAAPPQTWYIPHPQKDRRKLLPHLRERRVRAAKLPGSDAPAVARLSLISPRPRPMPWHRPVLSTPGSTLEYRHFRSQAALRMEKLQPAWKAKSPIGSAARREK